MDDILQNNQMDILKTFPNALLWIKNVSIWIQILLKFFCSNGPIENKSIGAGIKHQAITLTNVDKNQWCHITVS